MIKKGWCLLLVVSLIGCATQTVTIIGEPKDAKIYVDGEYLGQGQGSFEAGLKYDIPKSHSIKLTHKDFEDFETDIRNKLDVRAATGFAAFNIGVGLLDILVWALLTADYPSSSDVSLYVGIGTILISPIYYAITYKFKDVYSYDLRE